MNIKEANLIHIYLPISASPSPEKDNDKCEVFLARAIQDARNESKEKKIESHILSIM